MKIKKKKRLAGALNTQTSEDSSISVSLNFKLVCIHLILNLCKKNLIHERPSHNKAWKRKFRLEQDLSL